MCWHAMSFEVHVRLGSPLYGACVHIFRKGETQQLPRSSLYEVLLKGCTGRIAPRGSITPASRGAAGMPGRIADALSRGGGALDIMQISPDQKKHMKKVAAIKVCRR